MKRLYFVRHGESLLNLERIYAGQIDTPLTDHGREQARYAGKQAVSIPIDTVVSSPLVRALETAQIIANSTDYPLERIVVDPVFMERSLGSLEGHSWDEVGEDEVLFPDIESMEDLIARARRGLTFLHELEAENILLVSHGSLSRALRMAIDPSGTYDEPPNAQIVQLV